MFVLLRTIDSSGGFLKRKYLKKRIRNSMPVSVSTENGMPFYMVDVFNDKNGPDYSVIEEKCGCYASRIVAPRSFSLPDKPNLKRFLPGYSSGIFIFNTAVNIIKQTNPAPLKTSITVIDRNAVMHGEIVKLIPWSSPLRVVTSRPERYTETCQKIYNEYGASVLLRSFYEPAAKNDIVISCDGATSASMSNAAVFTFKRGINGKLRFHGNGINLSDHHKEIIPHNIEPADFAAAVTELCASTAYKSAFYSDIETSCKRCGRADPSECLGCYISGKCAV